MKLAALVSAIAIAASTAACGGEAVVQQGPSDALRAYAQALEQGRVDEAYRLLSDEAKRSMSLEAFQRAVKENPQDVLEIARSIARPSSDPVVMATVTVPNGDEIVLVFEGGKWRIDAAAVDLYGQATPRQAILGFLRAFERKRYDVIMRYVPDAEKEGLAGLGGGGELSDGAGDGGGAAGANGANGQGANGANGEAGGFARPPAGTAPPPSQAPITPRKTSADSVELTPEKLKEAWEGPQKEQINRIVLAIKAALLTANIEEAGDSAAMAYGAGGTVAFVREHGAWKIKDF